MEEKTEKTPPVRQAWNISLTPQQRLELVQMLSTGPVVHGRAQMKIFDRFKAAFGLDAIIDAAEKSEGLINARQGQSRTPQQHLVTLENAEFLLKTFIEQLQMNSRQVSLLTPLIENLEALVKGDPALSEPQGREYDPAKEQWLRDD